MLKVGIAGFEVVGKKVHIYMSADVNVGGFQFVITNSDSNNFNVDLDSYHGPLDVLLDLAKAQKVDLENISITLLADQFHKYITTVLLYEYLYGVVLPPNHAKD